MSVSISVSQTLTGVATLCFDVGASQNRIHVSLPSTSAEGGAYEKEVIFGNTYQRDTSLVMDGDTAASSQRFKVQGTYPLTDSKGVTKDVALDESLLAGAIVKTFAQPTYRPTALERKYSSRNTVFSLHLAFAHAYMALSELSGVPVENIQVSWRVFVLIPPQHSKVGDDVEGGKKAMAALVHSVKNIHFESPQIVKDIAIAPGNVAVLSEGFMALIASQYFERKLSQPDGTVKTVIESYPSKSADGGHTSTELHPGDVTLIVDIGQGTTDFFGIAGVSTPIDNLIGTADVGGNNVGAVLSQALKSSKFGIELKTVEECNRAVQTSRIRVGGSLKGITGFVDRARQQVAETLREKLIRLFESSGFSLSDVTHVFFTGGGSLRGTAVRDGREVVTDSLGTLLFEMLQQYGLSDAQRIENVSNDPQDVRLANLRGLRLMSLHPSVKGY